MPQAVVQGRKLYYELHGDHGAPTLVLLTGARGSRRGWLPLQVPAFSKVRNTLIFDYPGAGDSEPYAGGFSTEQLADTTAALLEVLEIEQADLLGTFMGGMVAQQLALRHPERVRKLVLVGTYARPDAKRRMLVTLWRDLAGTNAPLELQLRSGLLWSLSSETLEQTDLIASMLDFYEREGPAMTVETFRQQCLACTEHDVLDRLREIQAPTLVICGSEDRFTSPRLHREMVQELPDAHLVTLTNAAHLVMVEATERFNHTVLEFLDE